MSSLISQPSLLLSYHKYRSDPALRLATWHIVLTTLGSSQILDLQDKITVFSALLAATYQANLIDWARPSGNELQELTERLLVEAFNGNVSSSNLIVDLMRMPGKYY